MRIDQPKSRTVSDSNATPVASSVTRFESALQNANNNKFHVLAAQPGPTDSGKPKVDDKTRALVEATGDQAAIKALDDPNLADISNTGPGLSDYGSVEKISDNVLKLTMRDGKVVIVVKQVTPYLFDSVAGNSDAANAIHKSEGEGYRPAQQGDTRPGLGDYKNIGPADEVGPGLIRYETQSGQKVIVSKTTNPDLYDQVKADGETWTIINTSQKDGYRLAGPNEPAGMHLIGNPEELGHGLIRYETASGDKVIVSKDITPDLYDQAVKFSDGVAGKPGASSTDWIDNSKYSSPSAWDKIVGNKSGKPTQEEKDLDRPLAAAKMLADNWEKWGLHDGPIDFKNPPANLPPEAQACLKYVSGSPSLMAALTSGGGMTKTDTTITRNDVDGFIDHAEGDVKGASDAYEKFLKNNPNASDLAKENAKSAAIVMANSTLVSSAGDDIKYNQRPDKGGAISPGKLGQLLNFDSSFNTSNLTAIENDPGLSKSLTGAAGYWSSPGMAHTFDVGGDNPLTSKSDGVAMEHNIGSWLEKQAPADDDGVLMMLSNAAIRNSVADVDTSKLTKDVLEHPENYDAKTKAAVLLQLTDTRTKLTLSANPKDGSDLFAGDPSRQRGLNPNKQKVLAQLDDAIDKLALDPEVAKFISDSQGAGMKAIVDSNPEFKVALQHFQDTKVNNGQILNDALAMKDASGNPLSLGDALRLTATDAALTDLALGGDGKVDLAAIADKSGKSADIQKYFQEHILNSKDLQDALAADKQKNGDKADPLSVIKKFAGDAAAFQAFLGDKLSAEDKMELQTTVNDAISDTILGSANADSLKSLFADDSGNFDEAKVTEIIGKAKEADPGMFTDATGAPIATSDVVSMMRSVWDSVRQGNKIADVLPKVIDGLKLNVSDAYKQGLLHIGSSMLAGGVLVVRSVGGGNTAADNASKVAAGMQFFGTLVEGGSKYAKENGQFLHFQTRPMIDPVTHQPTTVSGMFPADFNKLANAAKIIGGAGTFIGGVLDLYSGINSALNGDKLNAGFSLTAGGLSLIGGFASIIEGAAGFFSASATASWAGVAAGVAGWAGAVFGAVAVVVLPVIMVFKRVKEQDGFYDSIVPTLTQYGLTGGPIEDGDQKQPDPIPSGTG